MAHEIVLGRSEADFKRLGTKGAVFLGKQYVKMGQTTSLSNPIYLDIIGAHVVFVCGKRGGGKSYTMGVIAEGMVDQPEEIKQNLAIVMLDTMGIYWTMKYPNKRDEKLLQDWGLKAKALDVVIYTPVGFFKQFKEEGVPCDYPFSIRPGELSSLDWALTFGVSLTDPIGIMIENILTHFREKKKDDFGIDDMIAVVEKDKASDANVKNAVKNRLLSAKSWGLFSKEGTPLNELVKGGQVTILDVSAYVVTPGAEGLRALVIGLVAKKLFIQRMIARKKEEFDAVKAGVHYLTESDVSKKQSEPLVWLVIDEAHEFLPLEGKTAASDALITILREGRQPGISLILATQQPGKIHTDVMTQSDILLSHRITAKMDTDALGKLMQSYMREGLDKHLNNLPRMKGAALVLDDNNERMFPMRVRPRFTWHGGQSPSALHEKKKVFSF